MIKIQVPSKKGRYPVFVGAGIVSRTGKVLSDLGCEGKVLIVSQKKIAKHYLKPIRASLQKKGYRVSEYLLPNGEKAKSKEFLFKLLDALFRADLERGSTVLAVGGGVVGDLAGFAASIYLRGIRYVNVATTLLAQIDSSIGGKTAINVSQGKNLVGAFYAPSAVISDTRTLETLPKREFVASLGEALKYGMISDAKLFAFLEKSPTLVLKRQKSAMKRIVESSARIKAGVVTRDEHETTGERMVLNFGHTFGHAFERALGYKKILHGEGVAIGMIAASRLAVELGLFSEKDHERFVRVTGALKLPRSLKRFSLKKTHVLEAMKHDKKKKDGSLRFILPKKIGKVVVRKDVAPGAIRKALGEVGLA